MRPTGTRIRRCRITGRWRGVTSGEDLAKSGVVHDERAVRAFGRAATACARARARAHERIGLPQRRRRRSMSCRAPARPANFDPTKLVDKSTFAQIMRRVFGARDTKIHATKRQGQPVRPAAACIRPKRTWSPSALEGVAPGLYHYHPIEHALEPLPTPAEG